MAAKTYQNDYITEHIINQNDELTDIVIIWLLYIIFLYFLIYHGSMCYSDRFMFLLLKLRLNAIQKIVDGDVLVPSHERTLKVTMF